MTDSNSFYDAFARRMNLDSNENAQRPRIGVTGDAYEFTTDGIRRERTNVNDDAYMSMAGSHHIRNGTGKATS